MINNPIPLALPTREAISAMAPFIGIGLKDIYVITTPKEASLALDSLLGEPFLGFDTESRPTFRVGQLSEGPHVLQFATSKEAYIFQSCRSVCRPAIAKIMESKHIAKIGFGLKEDIKRTTAKFGIHPRTIIDIDNTFKRLGHTDTIGIKTAIALLFGKRMTKSHKATTSNWSSELLSEKQLLYAANDAFAALAVFTELKKRGIDPEISGSGS
jgi:ribonuclease D